MQGTKDRVSGMGFELRMRVAKRLLESVAYEAIREELAGLGVAAEAMPQDSSFRSYRETEEYRVYHHTAMIRLQLADLDEAALDEQAAKLEKQARVVALQQLWRDLEDPSLAFEQRLKVQDRLQGMRRADLSTDRQELNTRKHAFRAEHQPTETMLSAVRQGVRVCQEMKREDVDASLKQAAYEGTTTLIHGARRA
jgi:hypothetical protein